MKFFIDETRGVTGLPYTRIQHEGYSLMLARKPLGHHGTDVFFRTKFGAVTSQDWARGRDFNTSFQYVLIGPGLDDSVGMLLTAGVQKPPVVIDPFEYQRAETMLSYALQEGIHPELMRRIEELQGRCISMLDNSKVHLVTSTLGEAMRTRQDLEGIADVVINHNRLQTIVNTEMNPNYSRRARHKEERRTQSRVHSWIDKLKK